MYADATAPELNAVVKATATTISNETALPSNLALVALRFGRLIAPPYLYGRDVSGRSQELLRILSKLNTYPYGNIFRFDNSICTMPNCGIRIGPLPCLKNFGLLLIPKSWT